MRAASATRNAPAPSRRRARQQRRRARRRTAFGIGLLCSLTVLGGTAFVVIGSGGDTGAGGPTAQARPIPPLASSAAPAVQKTETPAPTPTPTPTPTTVVEKGKGTFTIATSKGGAVGKGTIRRYRVEVEDGIGIDPQAAAQQVQAILSDKRSWTADGKNGFKLVSDGVYDFTVKVASPTTVDQICGSAGLDTKGEVNCDVGKQVVVNSKRWLTGSPQFSGTLDDYRALIVNHEVGHRIGHGHEGCPGKGKPAPAMMQQIYGLNGCVANAWPYTADGTYISGPSVP
ncbi:uncharacterized protein DUF3152 [Streptomyces sp. TLI_235]|nr:DUF3152 domain-containing protein [Streptomyces sp. TLI_235]PBC78691.1 uncharacterized protein DUF3152 [Streptomyces sp. TLI_235]